VSNQNVNEQALNDYDEFSMFADNASEVGLPYDAPPVVQRASVDVSGGLKLSALVWGTAEPQLVLLHGGAQNSHTWDTVALALGIPLVAIDLPGHGHSDWRPGGDYLPDKMADDVAIAVRQLAPNAAAVVGMSLGGLTAICLAADHPELVPRLGIVDVTPGTDHAKAEPIIAFVSGPEHFADFDEILARTIEHNPTRTESSLRRGVLHNAKGLPDGRWTWRYDPMRSWKIGADGDKLDVPGPERPPRAEGAAPDFAPLWSKVDVIKAPITLYRGSLSGVVGDEDVVELLRRKPDATVMVVDGAGHSIQGDRPVELAALLRDLLAS
jgi:pimeloyl-ACP methyl ester carboxylesterase